MGWRWRKWDSPWKRGGEGTVLEKEKKGSKRGEIWGVERIKRKDLSKGAMVRTGHYSQIKKRGKESLKSLGK